MAAVAPLMLAACDPNMNGGGAPVTRSQIATNPCGASVTAYAGDTVYSIARRCNVSVRELIEANRLQAPYQINSGMTLRIPGGSGEYVVQRGDTLLVVARKLGVDFQALARTNGKSAPYTIFVGEKLRVPGSYPASQLAQAPMAGNGGSLVISSPNAVSSRPSARTAPVASPNTYSRQPQPAPEPMASPPQQPQTAQIQSSAPPQSQPQPQPQGSPGNGGAMMPEPRPVSSSGGTALAQQPPPPATPAQPAPPVQQQASLPPPPPPPLAGRGFIWPLRGEVLNEFGPMAKGQHNDGVNIAAPRGTPVKASENGVVAYVGNELKGFGNLLLIKHADGWMTAYAHNDQMLVHKGDQVRRGQQIATVGSSGNVTQPQLHFELRKGTEAVNPADHIKGDLVSFLKALDAGEGA